MHSMSKWCTCILIAFVVCDSSPLTAHVMIRAQRSCVIAATIEARANVWDGRDQERVAIAYEQAGDWRNAARLWQELIQQQPTVSRYLVGALRSLKMLGSYEGMISIFEASNQQARSWEALAYYGLALMRTGKTDAARNAWNTALNLLSSEPDFRVVASLQIEAGSPQLAAITYRSARKRLNNPALFAEELAQLAIVARDLATALEEIFTYFDATKNLSRTQGLIATLLAWEDSQQAVLQRVSAYARRNDDNVLALRLYEWTCREVGDYATALDVVTAIERRTGQTGRELYAFAERARTEGAYDIALRAYGRLMDMVKQPDMRTMALYGYVQTLEQQTLHSTAPSPQQLQRIIAEYDRIVEEYPNSGVAINALLRTAELERDWGDPRRALARYQTLLSRYPTTEQAARGRLQRLPLLLSQYGIDSVRVLFESERPLLMAYPDLRLEAVFTSAEFDFFRCQFTAAVEQYRQVSSNSESLLANDAIERMTLISINQNDSLSLCRLAHAEQLLYQRQWEQGLALLDTVGGQDSDLGEYALMRAGSVALDRLLYAQAAHYFAELIKRFPETIYADRALWGLALAANAAGDRQQAIALLTQLLTQFPNSIYVPRARLIVRSLRGA
jgi:tetratricopeptide (TPR) repeat protein